MSDIIAAIKKVLAQKSYLAGFIVISIGIFWLFLAIPVKTVPGNTFALQLRILLDTGQFFLLAALSLLTSLSLVLHVYTFRHKHSLRSDELKHSVATGASLVGSGTTGFVSGVIATIFGSATCGYCVAAFFGFLGIGGVLFLIEYRTWITIAAIALMLISLYFTSRKVLGVCERCTIHGKNL